MVADGISLRTVARKLKIDIRTARKWVARHNATGAVDAIALKGRPLALSQKACERGLQLLIDPEVGGTRCVTQELKAEGLIASGVHHTTVTRAVKRFAESLGDPLVCLRGTPAKALSDENKEKRLAFAKANLGRNWDRVLFTDRKKFSFKYPGVRVRSVRWKLRSQKRLDRVRKPNHPTVYNVYGGISKFGVTRLLPVTGTAGLKTTYKTKNKTDARNITSSEYRDVCTKLFFPQGRRIFSSQGLSKFCLQQDGDPTHRVARAEICSWNCKGNFHVELVENWPGNSPDLNPIENVWAWVDRRVQAMGCKTFVQFKAAVDKSFAEIPRPMLKNLVRSMRGRLLKVVEYDGDKTGY
jgi:hypothetical protein